MECSNDKSCNDLGNGAVECKEVCTTKSTKKCYDNNVYYYDSCGTRELLVERCGNDTCNDSETQAFCDTGSNNTDLCENVNCPVNSECKVSDNNETACYCSQGYHVNTEFTACEADGSADLCETINCPANSHCGVTNDQTSCYCDDGYTVNEEQTACINEVCAGIDCAQWYPNSVCIEYNNAPGCDCQPGYHWSGDACVR